MDKEVGFVYGTLGGTIEEQAEKQGLSLGDKAEELEKIRKAITLLMFKDILTDSQIDMAYKKLHKKVVKALVAI